MKRNKRKISKTLLKQKQQKFEEFRNNIFCRRDDNQYKARLLWKDISILLSKDIVRHFETEWSHWLIGGNYELTDIEIFSRDFEDLKKEWENIIN